MSQIVEKDLDPLADQLIAKVRAIKLAESRDLQSQSSREVSDFKFSKRFSLDGSLTFLSFDRAISFHTLPPCC